MPSIVRPRFVGIEGLRGYLALWVALDHGCKMAGYVTGSLLFKLLIMGGIAVCGFIIVSGFVIANLILTKREPYGVYLVRRFARIFPIYALTCICGYFVSDMFAADLRAFHWSPAGWADFKNLIEALASEVHVRFWPHALAHLVMLHGVLPAQILPHASATLIPTAWSLSLEWQFYLVAPLILLLVPSARGLFALMIGATVCVGLYRLHVLGNYQQISTLPAALWLFLIGVFSRFWLEVAMRDWTRCVSFLVAGILAAALIGNAAAVAAFFWSIFYFYMLWNRSAAGGKTYRFLFENPISRYLGKISYSIYLSHLVVLVLAGYAALHLIRDVTRPQMLMVNAAAIVLTVAVSAVLFALVEKPGIALGHLWARQMLPRTSMHRRPCWISR